MSTITKTVNLGGNKFLRVETGPRIGGIYIYEDNNGVKKYLAYLSEKGARGLRKAIGEIYGIGKKEEE